MQCSLYYRYGPNTYRLGTFQNREKAESYWNLIKTRLEDDLGTGIEPIYVEQGKGRGK